MFNYLATVEFDEETDCYEISFVDFPDIEGTAYCEEDIELEATETLMTGLTDFISSKKSIPLPSQSAEHETLSVHLPILCCLKIALHNAIIQTNTRKADLARKLNLNSQQIDRLLDIEHASKVDALEQALYLLGYDINLTINQRCN
ncbi:MULTISPECIES: hypothetical protein [Providencia]|uniref:Antitoxin HicB n=1 Tax=Providencia stuartii TaxID=588 RepID=A0A1S1HRZ6_PROST|nr:antitoxin HicB [Providencia stuartii]